MAISSVQEIGPVLYSDKKEKEGIDDKMESGSGYIRK